MAVQELLRPGVSTFEEVRLITTTVPCGAVPAREGVSSSQFFLANFYAERLAGTQYSPALRSEASTARRAAADPSENARNSATPVAAATR